MKSFVATLLTLAVAGIKIQDTTTAPAEPAWVTQMKALGACLDAHGNNDGQVQAGEIEAALKHLVEEEGMDVYYYDKAIEHAEDKGIEADTVIDEKIGKKLVKKVFKELDVPKSEWADKIAKAVGMCDGELQKKTAAATTATTE